MPTSEWFDALPPRPNLRSPLFSYQNLCLTGTVPMEEAAIHRLATSITQLTLCQVSMEEIQASAGLLEKASRQLRNVPGVLLQHITDLERATCHLHCTPTSSRVAQLYCLSEP